MNRSLGGSLNVLRVLSSNGKKKYHVVIVRAFSKPTIAPFVRDKKKKKRYTKCKVKKIFTSSRT